MNSTPSKHSTRGFQTRRRAVSNYSDSQNTFSKSYRLESSYKTQFDLAVKGVLFESLYPLGQDEIAERMTWLLTDTKYNLINRVFASLQRLISRNLVAATRVVEQGREVTKYLLNLPYEDLQRERAARVRTQQLQNQK